MEDNILPYKDRSKFIAQQYAKCDKMSQLSHKEMKSANPQLLATRNAYERKLLHNYATGLGLLHDTVTIGDYGSFVADLVDVKQCISKANLEWNSPYFHPLDYEYRKRQILAAIKQKSKRPNKYVRILPAIRVVKIPNFFPELILLIAQYC